ncbi:MAG: hypothetical protein ACOYL6_06615 [Bacteriovoracaceae bacterium]
MKALIICSLMAFSSLALAIDEVVECSTNKGELKLFITRSPYNKKKIENNIKIEVSQGDKLANVFYGIKAEDSQTQLTNSSNMFIGKAETTQKVGGGHTDSIILNIERTKASLAFQGSVYLLSCSAVVVQD